MEQTKNEEIRIKIIQPLRSAKKKQETHFEHDCTRTYSFIKSLLPSRLSFLTPFSTLQAILASMSKRLECNHTPDTVNLRTISQNQILNLLRLMVFRTDINIGISYPLKKRLFLKK
jgi:hypothetical protein